MACGFGHAEAGLARLDGTLPHGLIELGYSSAHGPDQTSCNVTSDDPKQLSCALRFDPGSHQVSCKAASDLALDAASNCVPSEETSGPARAAHSDHVPALDHSET